jgi:hypothetical protein
MDVPIKSEIAGFVIFAGSVVALYLYLKFPDDETDKPSLRLLTKPLFVMYALIILVYIGFQIYRFSK